MMTLVLSELNLDICRTWHRGPSVRTNVVYIHNHSNCQQAREIRLVLFPTLAPL